MVGTSKRFNHRVKAIILWLEGMGRYSEMVPVGGLELIIKSMTYTFKLFLPT